MGASGSKAAASGSIRDPFRIDSATDRDLDTLTFVTTRVLNTPDIYDINNLFSVGTCGQYAIFMKEVIEKRLLNPFVVKTKDGIKKEIVYQDPRKLIPKLEDRKEICSQVAIAAIQAVSTIVACLASIQVAYSPRMVPPQTGGGLTEVRPWLFQNGIITRDDALAKIPVEMNVSNAQRTKKTRFFLVLEESRHDLTTGWTVARSDPDGPEPKLPSAEGLRIHFLLPIILTQGPPAVSALPVRIMDNAGRPWLVGILIKTPGQSKASFKSFVTSNSSSVIELSDAIELLFLRSMGLQSQVFGFTETRDQLKAANDIFEKIRSQPTSGFSYLQTYLGDFFKAANIIVTAPGSYPTAPPPGYPPAPILYPQSYGYPGQQPVLQPQPQPIQTLQPFAQITGAPALRPYAPGVGVGAQPTGLTDVTYDVPPNSAKFIRDSYNRFRDAHNKQSSPALVRAKTLAGSLNDDRTVTVGACQDPYWTQTNMSQIYPWVTFQYLCIRDMMVAGDPSKISFESEWTSFLEDLNRIYSPLGLSISTGSSVPAAVAAVAALPIGAPAPAPPPRSDLLERISIKGANSIYFCSNPRTEYPAIQDGLLRIQGLYEEHVKKIWGILNSLIIVIEDPVRKSRIVRLHPSATTGTESSLEYIKLRAAEARKVIKEFYINIEETYVNTLVRAFPKKA